MRACRRGATLRDDSELVNRACWTDNLIPFCAEQGVGAFLIVVHRFAQVMQETSHSADLFVGAQLGRQDG